MKLTTEELKAIIKEELAAVLSEKDDRCTRIAKSKYDVWPSAYASGAVVRCRDGKIWKDIKEELVNEEEMTDAEKEELEKIRGELEGASKTHKGQADRIGDLLNEDELEEAVYQGRTVPLNKPMRGDVKKFKVYVNSGKKDAEGRVVAKKVNFGHGGSSAKSKGEKTMKIRKSNPKARKNFRARHNCDNPGPKDKARYWSCKKW